MFNYVRRHYDTAHDIPNLGTRWMWAGNPATRPRWPRQPLYRGRKGPNTGQDATMNRKQANLSPLPRIEPRLPPSSSRSLVATPTKLFLQ
jgi:hypothetical protein